MAEKIRHFVSVNSYVKIVKEGEQKLECLVVYPSYTITGNDIMKKGGKFYAVLTDNDMWSQNEGDVYKIIDDDVTTYISEHYKADGYGVYRDDKGRRVVPSLLNNSSTNRLKEFNVWFSNLPTNHNYVQLDTEITFKSTDVKPNMYRSKRLKYDLKEGNFESYDILMSTLYSEEDRQKIEWSIGSVLSGASKTIEKLLVIYGDPGTGKSTILDIIKRIFEGYWTVFVASDLANKNQQFATAPFKDNPLVAIQDDGSLSKIDSPIINEIVSHKDIIINEKSIRHYTVKANAFLFLATNETVDLHDTKLGITRRLLDVYPSGRRFPVEEYRAIVKKLSFETEAIAYHCYEVFQKLGKDYYESYRPIEMIQRTNYLQNFLFDSLDALTGKEFFTRNELYARYKTYCEESGLGFPPKRIVFGEQLKEYFETYEMIKWVNGRTERHVYTGLKINKISGINDKEESITNTNWLVFSEQLSTIDKLYGDMPAQYSKEDGKPICRWKNCTTTLKDIDTSKLHWFKLPPNIIKIDFDKKDENGNKNLELNIKAANEFPKTYAEISQSGQGIHLYYIWDGDVSEISRMYDKDIEVKLSTGDNPHRRILTKCNGLAIAHLSSGLPLKEKGAKMVDENVVVNEKALRTTIAKCIAKEVHGDTRSNIDWIYAILEKAYVSGIPYDVSDLRQDVLIFAANSTHQSEYCINKVGQMKFKSEEKGKYDNSYSEESPLIFFDMEVKPNMNLLCWKYEGDDQPVVKMFNPTPEQIAQFTGMSMPNKPKNIGFNNKEYDNHILYSIWLGQSAYEVFLRSTAIINKEYGAKYREAYNLSYSDIYDFCPKKQSLKKWEIELGIHHQEFPLPWDEPIPEELWPQLAEYCANDVIATEAVFKANKAAWKGRLILCDLANIIMGPGSTVNDSTNDLTTKLIVGDEPNPQQYFVYPDLSKLFPGYEYNASGIDPDRYISKDVIISGKSIYRGYDPGEGGFVWAEEKMYDYVDSYDSASHHPSSLIAENGFGIFTPNYKRLLDLRLCVKHREYDKIRQMYDGALAKYLETDEDADALSFALKIAINSVYGLTAARFKHKLRDPRNVDNWVAKRGALFMIDLMLAAKEQGYEVAHCKTDSIKIAHPDDNVRNFIYEFGKKYGYTFELEHSFDRICLVNDAVYVCKYTDDPANGKKAGKWDATGKQFKVPYVFKTLFSHEPIKFEDLCETKSVSTAMYLDLNEDLPEGEHNYQFIGKTGLFCPMKPGKGGGVLCRENGDGKYSAPEGTKGYLWMEAEVVKALGKEDDINLDYYNRLVDKAVDTISKYGDFEWFVSGGPIMSAE